jgi:predicted nuclease of restriction endonuclease-like (RecB) superfamily
VKRSSRKGPAAAAPEENAVAAPSAAGLETLVERVVSILAAAQTQVVRSVNSAMLIAYWHIGRELVGHVQGGDERAAYGGRVLEQLAAQLNALVGGGYSASNLRYFRLFYQCYAEREPAIRDKPCDEFGDGSDALARRPQGLSGFSPRLSWSHYRTLTKVAQPDERAFYEIEAERQNWSVPHLARQIGTHLFLRLHKSRDKAGVMALATQGQVVERPLDVLRDPYVLDFLSLPEAHRLRESDLEGALIENLQHFLLELGTGFAFIGRQKRISFDLVFYHVILKCYVLIDLKLGSLTHQDVGQMDGYVRLYDDLCRHEGDGPTVGLILCAEKNDAVARYSSLHDSEQLFAARYVTYLPTVEELEAELRRERARAEAMLAEGRAGRRVTSRRKQ